MLAARGLERGRLRAVPLAARPAKGVDDLIAGFARSRGRDDLRLVIAGNGPDADAPAGARRRVAAPPTGSCSSTTSTTPRSAYLMAGCAAFVLPSKPRPEFVETFGIALVEKMLAGGGPIITTDTGGIREAVGDTRIIVPVDDPDGHRRRHRRASSRCPPDERAGGPTRARAHALQFDRGVVFDRLFDGAGVLPARTPA